jgi:hypothetical protein
MTIEARSGSRLRWLAAVAAAGVPLTLTLLWLRTSTRERGSQLFHGGAPLTGRLTGHDDPLPPDSAQCQNCHDLESQPSAATPPRTGTAAGLPVDKVGPKLGTSSLTHAAKRRGGPATAYTAGAFCRLLREGVDPAEIMIPQLMPRYKVTDAECNALWAYLTSN